MRPHAAPCATAKLLQKPAYLKRRGEFVAVQTRGRRWRGHGLVLLALPSDTPPARIGLTISRRVGHAVCRNLIRRRLRQIVRMQLLALPTAHDCVIIALPGAKEMDFWQLQADLVALLGRARRQLGSPAS